VNGSELTPFQSVFRFAIELTALVCWGISGWQIADGPFRWLLVVALPVVAAAIWGTFRAPDDHSANGQAPIAVPGVVRLCLELDVLLGAAIVTALVWSPTVGIALAVAVVAHYATTVPRIRWLLAQRTSQSGSGTE
jgi:hypothetical protein